MSIRDDALRELASANVRKMEDVIRAGLPYGFDIARVRCHIFPDGVREYHYDGKPVLELHPVEFGDIFVEGGVTITATFKYRYLDKSTLSRG